MKKWVLISVLIVLAGSIYIFIPSQLKLSKVIRAGCSLGTANRCFYDTTQWAGWWPSDYPRAITGVFYSEIRVRTAGPEGSPIDGIMRIAQLGTDSMLIGWESSLPTGINPLKRIGAFHQRQLIEDRMDTILHAFRTFTENGKNVYGIDFQHTMSKDTVLVTMTGVSNGYPATGFIYGMIDSLKAYAAAQGAAELNFPMLNVSKLDDLHYKSQVAISLDKLLPGTKRIVIKRFVPWKMIEGEVHGGVYTVEKAFKELYNFRDDHHLSIMAVPFQSLITDRKKVSDSTKWVTRICAPIS